MKTTILTFDQVSKEVKTKISKLGKDALVKKFTEGKLTSQEETAAAVYYILKRESLTQEEVDKILVDQYNEYVNTIPEEKPAKKLTKAQQKAADAAKEVDTATVEIPAKSMAEKLSDAEDKIADEIKTEEEKPAAEPVIKLTAQEFPLFKQIEKIYKKNESAEIEIALLTKKVENIREFKGVLGSLMKKRILTYEGEKMTLLDLGLEMINGTMQYKQKAKNEQNYFVNKRVVVNIDGKDYEKSAYVRFLLRKENKLTCSEINIKLAEVGFSKLYHSELQRCKNQLGIVTVKDED